MKCFDIIIFLFIGISNYRIEYDAYRSDLESLTQQPRAEVSSIRLEEAQRQFQCQKANYDRLRSDVAIKLKFLEENKVSVCLNFIFKK